MNRIARFTPESTLITVVFYNPRTLKLAVVLSTGHVYVYSEVDAGTYADFTLASSAGKFYNRDIRGQFSSRRLANRHAPLA